LFLRGGAGMNCIKEAEELLVNYSDLKYSIERMESEIYRLGGKPKDIKAVRYDRVGSRTQYDQDDTLNTLFKIKKLAEMKRRTEEKIKQIDQVLEDIGKDPEYALYKEVLTLWYIENLPKDLIGDEIGYSSRKSVYMLRNKAIKKFAIMLFGMDSIGESNGSSYGNAILI